MSNELLVFIIIGGIIALRWFGEFLLLAINYHYYWQKYRCRLEPWTHEWQRRVKRWWPILTMDTALFVALALCLLFFSPFILPFWAQITIIVLGVIVVAFYSWLLLHLGGFARWIINKIRGKEMKIDATDIAAYLVIAGCFLLMALGIDSEVKSILGMAAIWAFRRPIKNGVAAARKKITRRK